MNPPKIITSLFALSMIAIFTSCMQANKKEQLTASNKRSDSIYYKVDTSRITILPLRKISNFQIFKDASPADLSIEEYEEIDNLLEACIVNYNKSHSSDHHIDLADYKRQYVAAINADGEKEVWINCFCIGSFEDWKQNVVFVLDGGKCFFNVKINLTKKQCYDLGVNGYA